MFIQKFIKYRFEKYITKYLFRKAEDFNLKRGQPIVVFANDLIGVKINIFGQYEKEEIEDLLFFMTSNGIDLSEATAIDIGANIGNHSLVFSKISKKTLCFEPSPRIFDVLKINTKNINNIEIFNYGCGKNNETVNFYENFKNLGASSALQLFKYIDNIIKIQVKPLDEIIDTLSNIGLIKIDIEGMEADALKGAEKVITKFRPLICFEQHPEDFLIKFRETEAIDFLRSKGYKIFICQEKSPKNYISQKVLNFKKLMLGINNEREIAESKKIPKKYYNMIFALHSSCDHFAKKGYNIKS